MIHARASCRTGGRQLGADEGSRTALEARDYLVDLGVSADRLETVSHGKEVPLCSEHEEACWQRNRRGHMRITGEAGGH